MNKSQANTVSKQDLKNILDDRFSIFEEKMDQKFASKQDLQNLENRMNKKFVTKQDLKNLETKIDQKFISAENRTDEKFEEMAQMINRTFDNVVQLIQANHWELLAKIQDLDTKQSQLINKTEFNHLEKRVTILEQKIQ